MTKFAVIGDIHGKKSSPLDRLCDYNEDLYKKMEWIRDYCIENEIKNIFHLGDIADKPDMPDELKNRFIQIWRPYQSYGTFWSIIGLLHDTFNNDLSSYPRTCLYNLELSGIVKILREPIVIDSVEIYPLDPRTREAKIQLMQLEKQFKVGYEHVILGHQFYEWGLDKNSGITKEELETFGTSCSLLLGHDHRHYDIEQVGMVEVIRPGSLMRTELSETMISQRPCIAVYDNYKWKYVEVPHRDINEIYNVAEYRNNKSNVKVFKNLKNNLEDVSKYFHQDDTVIPCSQALADMSCPKEEYEYLRAVYQTIGQEF